MSTCSGTWRDARVPFDVGVLVCVKHEWVSHDVSARCDIGGGQPHVFAECGEFDASRPDFVQLQPAPGPQRPASVWVLDWDSIFARLDAGESMFTILAEHVA